MNNVDTYMQGQYHFKNNQNKTATLTVDAVLISFNVQIT